ncbi:hypothetical protein [uncultured Sunxiuqinia sp.]|uniref:hypothetical protein n=1 Tax=uncultured Sunxiuqinia sp. TaxID=1573825 RepID=UPI00261A366F|nr:hypothetical protein [uncultured Sunxiuqinia sp.]
MTKVTINYVPFTEIGYEKELVIAQQEKALAKEQFVYAVKLKFPDLELRRKALMQISRKVQDIKAMIYFGQRYPGKDMNQIVQCIMAEQKGGRHVR